MDPLMKNIIRIFSFIACIAALICAYIFAIIPLYFASAAFLLTFLATFVTAKQEAKNSGHTASQQGGHFSTNTQTVNFGSVEKKENDA